MWVRAFGRVAIASAICAALVAGCGKAENHPAGSAGTSSPGSTNAPAPVKADATYTESTLPIDFQSFATVVPMSTEDSSFFVPLVFPLCLRGELF